MLCLPQSQCWLPLHPSPPLPLCSGPSCGPGLSYRPQPSHLVRIFLTCSSRPRLLAARPAQRLFPNVSGPAFSPTRSAVNRVNLLAPYSLRARVMGSNSIRHLSFLWRIASASFIPFLFRF